MVILTSCKEISSNVVDNEHTYLTSSAAESEATAADTTSRELNTTDRSSVTMISDTDQATTNRTVPTDCELVTLTESTSQTTLSAQQLDGRIKVGSSGLFVRLPWDFQPLAEHPDAVSQRSFMRMLPTGETVYFKLDVWPMFFFNRDEAALHEIADDLNEVLIALDSDTWEYAQAKPFLLKSAERNSVTVNNLPFVRQTGTMARDENTDYYYVAYYGVAPITNTDISQIKTAPVRWILFTDRINEESTQYMCKLEEQICNSFFYN